MGKIKSRCLFESYSNNGKKRRLNFTYPLGTERNMQHEVAANRIQLMIEELAE